MSHKKLLLATDLAIIDIIDEYGPSTIDTLSAHTFCCPAQLIPHIRKLESIKLLTSTYDGSDNVYTLL